MVATFSKDTEDYLSYSRAYTFMMDRWEFTRRYILKEKKEGEDKESKFQKMHTIIEQYFIDSSQFRNKDEKQDRFMTRQLRDFYAKNCPYFILTPAEDEFLKNFVIWIDLDYNKDIKKCLESKIFSRSFQDFNLKIRGEMDAIDPYMILDFKGESISSLKFKKLKYALQQVIYLYLYKQELKLKNIERNPNMYFLSLPLTYPYSFNRFTFPESWVAGVENLFFNKILPSYNEYKEKVKKVLGNDIFTRKIEDKKKTLDNLINNQLLSIDFELTPSSYEYNDLDLMIIDNKHKVDFYKESMNE